MKDSRSSKLNRNRTESWPRLVRAEAERTVSPSGLPGTWQINQRHQALLLFQKYAEKALLMQGDRTYLDAIYKMLECFLIELMLGPAGTETRSDYLHKSYTRRDPICTFRGDPGPSGVVTSIEDDPMLTSVG